MQLFKKGINIVYGILTYSLDCHLNGLGYLKGKFGNSVSSKEHFIADRLVRTFVIEIDFKIKYT